MNKLQKRGLRRAQEILEKIQSIIFDLSREKDDSVIAREIRSCSTIGTAGSNILSAVRESADWIDDILGGDK